MESSGTNNPGISVLYVDDEPAFLDVMKLTLEHSGDFTVTTALDASSALQLLSTHPFDAIISDYQMPGMDGIGFLKAVRDQFGDIPFILFTGRGREEVVINAINNGADFYLQKGSDMKAQVAELTNKVHYAVSRRRVEMDLRESEERYRNVVEDQTEFICRFLPDGTHIFVNEAYCRYFGLERDEIIGSRFRPKIPPEDQKRVEVLLAYLSPDSPLGTIDQRIIMPDGTIRWQRWVDRAIYHADGSLKEYQSVGRDITELKRAEQALKESEEKYRTVFENTGTATVVIEEDRIISLANAEFTRLSGYSREEIEGKKCWTEFVVKEDLEWMVAQHHLRRQNHDKALTHYEFRFMTRSGDIRTIHLSIDTIPGTKKSIASLRDVTNWKKAQDDLVESEERFRQLFSRMPSGVAIYRAVDDGNDFVFSDFNVAAETIENIGRDDVIGKRVTEVFPGVKDFGIFPVFQRVWKTGTPEFFPGAMYRGSHDHGTWRDNWVYRLPTGEIVTIYNDITERKEAEEAIRKANRQLQLLTGITRHDISNSIMVAEGYLDLMEDPGAPPLPVYREKVRQALDRIKRQIQFTKEYETLGSQEPCWQDFDMLLQGLEAPHPVYLHRDRCDAEIFADPMLQKVFENLLDNSLRHGGDGLSEILVSCSVSDAGLTVTWGDNGAGVSLDEKEKIFSRGYGKGTGLGLFLVKEILGMTGITIHEAGIPGEGARFVITVPQGKWRSAGALT